MDHQKRFHWVAHAAAAMPSGWMIGLPVMLVGLSGWVGCYNGDDLVKRARSSALRATLAEVDLGSFHTTLPQDSRSKSLTELRLHVFAAVPRYHAPDVEKHLQAETYLLRHEVLAAIRNSTPAELAEPSLGRLRKRLESVVNGILDEAPVRFVGFYDFALRRT